MTDSIQDKTTSSIQSLEPAQSVESTQSDKNSATHTRKTLETLSTPDLCQLANEYGVLFGSLEEEAQNNFTAPKINRDALISEILNTITDDGEDDKGIEDRLFYGDDRVDPKLPMSYNTTEVDLVMKNPAWAFIYWHISTIDVRNLMRVAVNTLILRVNCFSSATQQKPNEVFDFSISRKDTNRYFLVPRGKKYLRVDLLFCLDGIIDILASSERVKIIDAPTQMSEETLWDGKTLDEVTLLSGAQQYLQKYYKVHRQTFS